MKVNLKLSARDISKPSSQHLKAGPSLSSRFVVLLGLALLTSTTACSSRFSSVEFQGNDSPVAQAQPALPIIVSSPASLTQCTAGGVIYRIVMDADRNGRYDEGETISSEQVICHGRSGSDGYSTAFNMQRVQTDAVACASGSGVQLSAGLDLNRSRTLEPAEIDHTEVICDGVRGSDGQMGPSGPAGRNGFSMAYQVVPASTAQCGAAGGSNILMALDIDGLGVYQAHFPSQSSMTICNGRAAAVSAYTPVQAVQPCRSPGATSSFSEVLLVLGNGQVLASVSQNTAGDNTRLSFIPDGSYMTTDGASCRFSLSTSGSTRSISWSNQVQMSWSITP